MLVDAALAQPGAGEQPAEAAADDDHVDLVGERLALDRLVDVRIVDEVRELAGDLDVLLVAVLADALVALVAVLLAQRIGVEGQLVGRHASDGTDAVGRAPNRGSVGQRQCSQ